MTKIPETGDVLPPSRVTDLQVAGTYETSLTLTWTATGDDLDSGIGESNEYIECLILLCFISYFIYLSYLS